MRLEPMLLVLLLARPAIAPAAEHQVPADFATIQAAIDACAPGDTVSLAPGTYLNVGNLDLDFHGVDLLLRGTGPTPAATVLDGGAGTQRALLFDADDGRGAVVENMTLRGFGRWWSGTAIRCQGGSPVLRDLVFEDCGLPVDSDPANLGGAIVLRSHGDLLVEGCVFRNCSTQFGGAIHVGDQSRLTCVNTRFEDCRAIDGGAIALGSAQPTGPVLALQDCAFLRCRAEGAWGEWEAYGGSGGAISLGSAQATITDTAFEDCVAVFASGTDSGGKGGAIYNGGQGRGTVERCSFLGCTGNEGAAIFTWANLDLARLTVAGNDGLVSALHLGTGETALGASIVADNRGAGLYGESGALLTMTCSDVHGNAGGDFAGQLSDPTGQDGNLSADPFFCTADFNGALPFAISSTSPCAPANNDCQTLMGRFEIGCSVDWYLVAGSIGDGDGNPLAGVELQGAYVPTVTDVNGDYAFAVPGGWTALIRPVEAGYGFIPGERLYSPLHADASDQDYLGFERTLIRVPGDYPSLGFALDYADLGDTILVAPGTYSGAGWVDIDLPNLDLTLISEAGSAATIIDLGQDGRFLTMSNLGIDEAVIGFTIRNGWVTSDSPVDGQGAAIRLHTSHALLKDLVIENCTAQTGGAGAILCRYSNPILEDVILRDNRTLAPDGRGGAIRCYYGDPILTRVAFVANEAPGGGGGLCLETDSSPVLRQVTFHGNRSDGPGGAVYCRDQSAMDLEGGMLTLNLASAGGGIHVETAAALPSVACSNLFGNTPDSYGGAIADQTGLNGNLSLWPDYCDIAAHDLRLLASSPGLPENNDCGLLMGAFGACEPTAAETPPAAGLALVAHPNPFNPVTTIRFILSAPGPVHLSAHDPAGRRVATLLDGAPRPAGAQSLNWDARGLPSGVYFLRLAAGGEEARIKLLLLK